MYPLDWTTNQDVLTSATLQVAGGKLLVGDWFALDRATFKVTKL